MPSVQPNAVTMLARMPRDRPAEIVSSAPVPGVATMTSDVIRKATLTRPSIVRAAAGPTKERLRVAAGVSSLHTLLCRTGR